MLVLSPGADMRRREFIALVGSAATTWPLAARAQQAERVRRVGVLNGRSRDDPEYQARMAAFQQALAQLGWTNGRNLQIDIRWATNADDLRRHAAELAALAPDVLVAATGTATMAPLLQTTRTVPIVFVIVIDPVGAGDGAFGGYVTFVAAPYRRQSVCVHGRPWDRTVQLLFRVEGPTRRQAAR